MNYNEQDSELFDLYLSESMGPEEKTAFEKRLEQDAPFSEAFRLHCMLTEGIRESARAALKTHIRDNAEIQYWGGTMWSRTTRFAAAAAFLIFASLYLIIRFYIDVPEKQHLAIESGPAPVSSGKQDSLYPDASGLASTLGPEEVVSTELPPPPPNAPEIKQAEVREDVVADMVEESKSADAETYDDQSDKNNKYATEPFRVLSESLRRDSIYFAQVLQPAYKEVNAANQVYAQGKVEKSGSRLPASVNNSKQAETIAKTEADKPDSVESKKSLTLKKANLSNGVRLHVEFWNSPVNFKGYRLIGSELRLYGVDENKITLLYYNSMLYMADQGKVYVMLPCSDACPFKPEADADISTYILEHTR